MRIVSVDLGKSRCRVRVDGGEASAGFSGVGAPGLATVDGVRAAEAAILPLLADAGPIELLGVGAAGAWVAPDAGRELAVRLARRVGAPVAVASDVVTAHAGALGGAPGVLLIAGTGAAALGVDATGVRLVDGWGPELGDLGSGSWLGREGLRAVLRASAGLGPQTALTAAVRAHIAPASDPITWLAGDVPVARQLATVAPLVLDAAESGDEVAGGIAETAVRLLTTSAIAAAEGSVVVHGGLTEHAWFRAALEAAITEAGRSVAPALADALAGAALVAARSDLPHERYVHRAG